MPKSCTDDRERCQAARIPDERTFATKGDLARDIIRRALASPLPIAWVTADSAYGQNSHFRRFLEDHGLSYVVAVPKSQPVHGPRIEEAGDQAEGECVPDGVDQLHGGEEGREGGAAGSGAEGSQCHSAPL
ncbi:transposase [Streptomyces sp. NPDC051636]|uniref:transposase n=1 Tax=Streptomyces sp. NPDC051636 TaxID=3365663 RepID=UPI0037884EEA